MDKLIVSQYQNKVNQAVKQFGDVSIRPPEGWVRTVRKALGMTALQLASRLGVSDRQISKTERSELNGGVKLQTLQNMAEAMNCRFVYAFVPEKDIKHVIREQATKKAKARVNAASTQMAFEDQALTNRQMDEQIERIVSELMDKMPSDLWSAE
jgi:predicted DNA-binding mobile mystery protein A